MRNRAKCKLCSSIIESFHSTDHVECKCGEILVNGGIAMMCAAKHWGNFLRVDDEGNEIVPLVKDENKSKIESEPDLTRKDLMEMLSAMAKNYKDLPPQAMSTSITHYDFTSLLILLDAIFEAES